MTISLPLSVYISKNKKYILNLNNYRNAHFIVNNKAKQAYCDILYEKLYKLRLEGQISLNFTLYKASNRKSDRSNVLSIQEKFFCDSLITYGCIKDDNDDIIIKTTYQSGGVDKNNPRVDVEII